MTASRNVENPYFYCKALRDFVKFNTRDRSISRNEMQRRRTLGKRHFGEFGSASGFITKRSRSDQEVPAMEDNGSSSSSIGNGSSSSGNGGASPRRPNKEILAKVPRYGTPVERTRVRTAGPYVLGHELGTSPGVPQTQYLARKDNTNEFYLLKVGRSVPLGLSLRFNAF